MSEQTQPTQPTQPTPEQLMKELEAWLAERNAAIVPVAVGRKTSQPANIEDWETETHRFGYIVVPKGKKQ
jgi:hypothetical protein